MLNNFLLTKIEEEDIGNIWFQQDGVTCHTAEATLDVLRSVFEDCIISRRADVVWPPRSCDLTPLGYYLWRIVKDKCYTDKPETIDALKDNIRETIVIKLFGGPFATQPKLHSMFCALFVKWLSSLKNNCSKKIRDICQLLQGPFREYTLLSMVAHGDLA